MRIGDLSDEKLLQLYKFEKIKETLVATINATPFTEDGVFYLSYIFGLGLFKCEICPASLYCQRLQDSDEKIHDCEEVIPRFISDANTKVERTV